MNGRVACPFTLCSETTRAPILLTFSNFSPPKSVAELPAAVQLTSVTDEFPYAITAPPLAPRPPVSAIPSRCNVDDSLTKKSELGVSIPSPPSTVAAVDPFDVPCNGLGAFSREKERVSLSFSMLTDIYCRLSKKYTNTYGVHPRQRPNDERLLCF